MIGESRYGVLAIAWLLLGYFGLLDLGLGRAAAQRIAVLTNRSDRERATAFWTTLTMNVGMGVVGGCLAWIAATYFFGQVFMVEDVIRREILSSTAWLALCVPVAMVSGVLSGALQGRADFLQLNIISVVGSVLFQILPLLAVMVWGGELGVVLPAAVFARLISIVLLFKRCHQQISRGQDYRFDWTESSRLLKFGGWVTVTSLVGPLMVVLDRFVIGALSGAKAVTYYTVPFELGERTSIVPNALSSALFPRFADSTREERAALAEHGLRTLVATMTPIVVVAVLFIGPFLAWWISPEFSRESTVVAQLILFGSWANSFAKIPYAQLQASGRPDIVAKCHVAELIPYFALLYLFVTEFGIAGAALAFSLRVVADFVALSYFSGVLSVSLGALRMPLALMLCSLALASSVGTGEPHRWLLAGLLLLATGVWACQAAPASIRGQVADRLGSAVTVISQLRKPSK